MENNEIMTSEINTSELENAEIETTDVSSYDSETGLDFGKAAVIVAGVCTLVGLTVKGAKKLYKKVNPIIKEKINENRKKKLEKEGYKVYGPDEFEANEDADFVVESEVVEDESEE